MKELHNFLSKLVEKYQPEKIISFGSLQDTTISSGCFMESSKVDTAHYFLLMVTSTDNRIASDVQDFATTHFSKGTITILVHGRSAVETAIRSSKLFFVTTYREGTVLYKADGLLLDDIEIPDTDPVTDLAEAEQIFRQRHLMALGFIKAANECLKNEYYNNAVFTLHQAVEQACIGMIWVYMGYRVDLHNLGRLLDLCKSFSPKPAAVFHRKTDRDKKLFDILRSSYSDTRYSSDFAVNAEDANTLFKRSHSLVMMSETLCQKKISQYTLESQQAAERIADYRPALPS
jgi:HEPN domain-containing protein